MFISIVDRFIDIYTRWPGSVHDARVLANSSIHQKAEEGILFPEVSK